MISYGLTFDPLTLVQSSLKVTVTGRRMKIVSQLWMHVMRWADHGLRANLNLQL